MALTPRAVLARLRFAAMYRLRFTPWDGHPLPARLRALADAPGKGRALDVGCGTGDTAIHLARAGWDVAAVDFVEHALERAREKARAAGVEVRFVRADVTTLSAADVGDGFRLIVDNGCLHGLPDASRDAYVERVTRLAAPGATLLVAAFPRGERRGPAGIDREEIERRFAPAWRLEASAIEPGVSSSPEHPIHVHELTRIQATRRRPPAG